MKKNIDIEVNKLVSFGYEQACEIILKNNRVFDLIANELLEKRTITEKDLVKYSVSMWDS